MAEGLPFAPPGSDFDILDWHPAHQSCLRYFLDHAQHTPASQALCALINIRLPFQRTGHAITSYKPGTFISAVPYIRRLIVTGFDTDGILHGFFGDAWERGIGPMRECERRNYLFAAKHGGWRTCKRHYDMNDEETVPFLRPLRDATAEELEAAERNWSSWLALEDWMVGPRAPHDDYSRNDGHDLVDGDRRR